MFDNNVEGLQVFNPLSMLEFNFCCHWIYLSAGPNVV